MSDLTQFWHRIQSLPMDDLNELIGPLVDAAAAAAHVRQERLCCADCEPADFAALVVAIDRLERRIQEVLDR